MIDTAEIRYFACMWFTQLSELSNGDFMGVLYQRHDSTWEMKYRFRYYASGDGSDDRKQWYLMKFKDTTNPDEMEAKFESVMAEIFGPSVVRRSKVDIRGDATKFVEVMSKQEWAHLHTSPSADAPS
jgi:hypothetical protein